MRSCILLAAALLLCASVHAQDTSSSAAVEAAIHDAQATPSSAAAPKHFGHPTCNRVLHGCKRCIMYYVKHQGKAAAATAAATPDHFGEIRKVYVCTECMKGYTLTGSGNLNDPKPKYCVKDNGGNTGQAGVASDLSELLCSVLLPQLGRHCCPTYLPFLHI